MDCQDCIERCYPSDPREFMNMSGRYHRPICDTCPNQDELSKLKPTSFEPPYPQRVIVRVEGHSLTPDGWKQLEQLMGDVKYIKAEFQRLYKKSDVRF